MSRGRLSLKDLAICLRVTLRELTETSTFILANRRQAQALLEQRLADRPTHHPCSILPAANSLFLDSDCR